MRLIRALSLLVFVSLSFAAFAQQAPVLVTQAVDNSVRTVLPGNVHPIARPEFDLGEAPPDLPLKRMLLVLKRSDQQEAALRRLIENQQYKKSPDYHRWLTPVEFGARFGPSDSDIAAVTNWLTASGFEVAQVSNGRTVIEFSGTAGLVKQAFGTAIHKFVVDGEEHWANVSNPSIPAALAPVVAGVNSLHNFLKKAQNSYAGKYSVNTKHLTSPKPDFTFGCGIATCYAVTPFDFATIYDLLPLWNAATPINGTGQTIAIVGRTDINPNDAPAFWGLFGLGKNGVPMPTLVITHNGPAPGINGDEPEADIDTQWSGAAAPGATINFVTSESTETTDGVDLSAIYIVDNNLAPVMSESYGQCEASLGTGGVNFYGNLWEEAAAQGITAMVSTGDNGSAGCDPSNSADAVNGLAVSGLASTPWNVAVGGTDFNEYNKWSTYWKPASGNNSVTQESAIGPIPETTWNDSCTNSLLQFLPGGSTNAEANCNNPSFAVPPPNGFLDIGGGSGGASAAWLKPTWQTGPGVPNDTARDLPDVSLFAADGYLLGSFYLICQSDMSPTGTCDVTNPSTDLQGYGGTSVASPAFAGIMALVNQKWGLQGNANLVLYNLSSKQPTAFHDVPAGSTNSVPCAKGSPNCTTTNVNDTYGILSGYSTTANYDLATGLGSVDANVLVTNWNKVTFTPTTTTLTLSTATVTHGTAVPVTVSVKPTSGSGTPTGDVALLVNPGTPGNPGIDWNTLTNGTVTWSTNLLPGGTYKVIAHYEGDATYGGSYSSPSANVTVNPEASSVYMPGVVVGTNATTGAPVYSNSVVYGTGAGFSYLLRADVENAGGNFCTTPVLGEIACPTGTVTFTDNTNPLDGGAFKLNSFGYTEDQGIQLTGGSHILVANYSGDANYTANTTTTTVTVTPAPTTINNVSAPAQAVVSQSFTVTAAVTSASYGVAPTGTVAFLANGSPLTGTVQYTPQSGNISTGITASLGASLSTSISTAGTDNITATYTSGDQNYASQSSSNSVPITINATGGFAIGPITNVTISAPGQSGSAALTITPANGFTGTVTIACALPVTMLEATCPNVTANITNANPVTPSVMINTMGPHQVAANRPAATGLFAFGVLAGVLLVAIPGVRRRRLPLALPLFGIVVLIASCGGGGSSGHTDPGTPAGTYTVNLTATSPGATTQTASFSVTVQ